LKLKCSPDLLTAFHIGLLLREREGRGEDIGEGRGGEEREGKEGNGKEGKGD